MGTAHVESSARVIDEDQQAATVSRQAEALNKLPEATPRLLKAQAQRILAARPTDEQLRRKLATTKGKHCRGLISLEEVG